MPFAGACEVLGYDVYQVANEGKTVCVVPAEQADAALKAMQNNVYGVDAAIIGEVVESPKIGFARFYSYRVWRFAHYGYACWRTIATHLLVFFCY